MELTMFSLEFSPRFRRQWRRLPLDHQRQVARALIKLQAGQGRRKRIVRHAKLFEIPVNGDYRLLWRYAECTSDRIWVEALVNHDTMND